jgi:V/A-type H+-transporting ATPase subunit F
VRSTHQNYRAACGRRNSKIWETGVPAINLLEFFVIADTHTRLAFALAGVRCGVADSRAQASEFLTQARQDPTVGIILITEPLAALIRAEVAAARRESERPLIVEIPDLSGPAPRPGSLLERLRSLSAMRP